MAKHITTYTPTNREKVMVANKSKWWCNKCDAAIVGDLGKCPACGCVQNRAKKK